MFLAHLVVIFRVKRGAAFDPGINRIGGDDIEFLPARADVMPAVVERPRSVKPLAAATVTESLRD
jgi:hypothetical protein